MVHAEPEKVARSARFEKNVDAENAAINAARAARKMVVKLKKGKTQLRTLRETSASFT